MAYDPYKSLLANATREHLKHSIDLNTHLVGNVFLPAIDSQLKKPSKSHASLKHLKVIEQCIMAENKREDRLAKCATSKARRVISKKFQAQRERERELIQALMLGQYPERLQDIKLLETEVVPAKTPRQQLNQEITGLTAKVATPDRVFRKTDVTGGVPKSKPHAHKKFTLPQCNGSPGKKSNAKAQAAAAANLSSRSRGISLRGREIQTQDSESPTQKKPSPSRLARSATIARTPKSQEEGTTAAAEANATSPNQRAHSPYISPHRLQLKTRTTPPLTSLQSKTVEVSNADEVVSSDVNSGDEQLKSSSVVFGGALSFSEAKQVAMGSNLLKAKVLAEIATQTTPRLQGSDQDGIQKTLSRPELPPMNPSSLAGSSHDATVTTPRRPQSCRVVRPTREAFLDSLLAKESTETQDRKEVQLQSSDPPPIEVADEGSDSNEEPATVGDKSPVSEDSADYGNDAFDPADDGSLEAEEHDEDDVDPDDNADDDLETDVAETLFDIVDMVEAAIADEEREAMPSPRTVSPRPRSSMDRTTKYVVRIQSVFRGYRARIAFRLALYEDALSCGVLGAMPGTIQGRSGWYLDPKRLMAYYFSIPEPGGDWEQKYTLRCSRLVLTPYEMREEVLSKVPALLQQSDVEQDEEGQQ
ncbi:hypothetical protein KRP22_001108 [Phytophthora ramorum]|nr:hypothetical protein KRP22_155 [Phytophthora ramorum]